MTPGSLYLNTAVGVVLWPWEWAGAEGRDYPCMERGDLCMIVARRDYGRSGRALLLTSRSEMGWVIEDAVTSMEQLVWS